AFGWYSNGEDQTGTAGQQYKDKYLAKHNAGRRRVWASKELPADCHGRLRLHSPGLHLLRRPETRRRELTLKLTQTKPAWPLWQPSGSGQSRNCG
ncbi:unnamed protein product, partial [Pleuronectes platessa]